MMITISLNLIWYVCAKNPAFTLSPDVEVPTGSLFVFAGDTDNSDNNANGVSNVCVCKKVLT